MEFVRGHGKTMTQKKGNFKTAFPKKQKRVGKTGRKNLRKNRAAQGLPVENRRWCTLGVDRDPPACFIPTPWKEAERQPKKVNR